MSKKRLKKLIIAALAFVLVCAFAATGACAATISYGAGTVSATVLNIRSGPSIMNEVVGTVSKDGIIVLIDKPEGDWYHVMYNGVEGYVASDYVKNILKAENFSATAEITCDWARMRTRPDLTAEIIGSYGKGTDMEVIGINNGWYKVKYLGRTGYIRSDLMQITGGVATESGTTLGSGSSGSSSSGGGYYSTGGTELGRQIADFALQYVGYPYIYGEESPSTGFDCSGLVWYVYTHFGYSMCRTATTQYNNNGRVVEKSELQAGDLVFFKEYTGGNSIGHVGIYIGGGKFVHASTSTVGVIISDLNSDNYTRRWYGAKRIIG
ncbi:MAG: C40 family peptidase [Oscillospiraceae bacterium]|nr:C40 family peptidase [Oscillospiraceae bacterium]